MKRTRSSSKNPVSGGQSALLAVAAILLAASLFYDRPQPPTLEVEAESAQAQRSLDMRRWNAIESCHEVIASSGRNRARLEYYPVTAPAVARLLPDETWEVRVKFSETSVFGVESTLTGRCIVSANGLNVTGFTAQDSP